MNRDLFPPSTPNDDKLYIAIGRLVLVWSQIEFACDGIIEFFRCYDPDDPKFRFKNFKSGFKSKTRYIEKCLTNIDIAKDIMHFYINIIKSINDLSEKRNEIIHGFVIKNEISKGDIHICRLNKDGCVEIEKTISAEEIDEITIDIIEYGSRISSLARRLAGLIGS